MTDMARPQPYKVDEKINKIQTIESDGDRRVRLRHDFLRLDMSNVDLLYKREKETVRTTEKLGKGRTRPRFDETKGDANFYKALVIGGGWRPAELMPVNDLGLVPDRWVHLYEVDPEDDDRFLPGWMELPREKMMRFAPERMKNAVEAFLNCWAKYVPQDDDGIDFMFDEGGIMRFDLLLGDPDDPAFRIPVEFRRPELTQRTTFRDNFAYIIDHSKGETGKTETIISYAAGTKFFAEHFANVPDLPICSQVVFEQQRISDDPPPTPVVEGDTPLYAEQPRIVPYNDSMRSLFMATLNPAYQAELASAVVLQYSQQDRE